MTLRCLPRGFQAAVVLTSFHLALSASRAEAQFAAPAAASDTPAAAAAAPASGDTFAFELGRAAVDRDGGAGSTYTVTATQDFRSKTAGGRVRLAVLEKAAGGTMTHLLTINTGKFKTVAQLTQILANIFRQDLATPAANQEIGKIGDLGHGGEIRFFAESNDLLRYDWAAPGEPVHSTRFKRADVQAFLGILTHPKAGG